MAPVGTLLVVLAVAAAAAARPQEADPPPAVEVKPEELAGDGTSYKLVPGDGAGGGQQLEESARALLEMLEPQSQQQEQKEALMEWAYASNITNENKEAMVSQPGRSGAGITGTPLSMVFNDGC